MWLRAGFGAPAGFGVGGTSSLPNTLASPPDGQRFLCFRSFQFWFYTCNHTSTCFWSACTSKFWIWNLWSSRLRHLYLILSSILCLIYPHCKLCHTGTAPAFGFGAQPAASNAFGQAPTPATPTFGQSVSSQSMGGFGFGQPQPAASIGFGVAPSSGPPSFGFGQSQPSASTAFGQTQASTSGGFGQPQPAAGSGFGQRPSASSNIFGFGQTAASPGFGFGTAQSSPAMFGQTQSVSTAAPSAPLFGATPGQSTPGDCCGCVLTLVLLAHHMAGCARIQTETPAVPFFRLFRLQYPGCSVTSCLPAMRTWSYGFCSYCHNVTISACLVATCTSGKGHSVTRVQANSTMQHQSCTCL